MAIRGQYHTGIPSWSLSVHHTHQVGPDHCSIQDPSSYQFPFQLPSSFSALPPQRQFELPPPPPVFTSAASLEAFQEHPFQLLSSSTLLVPVRQLAFAHFLLLTNTSATQPVLSSPDTFNHSRHLATHTTTGYRIYWRNELNSAITLT